MSFTKPVLPLISTTSDSNVHDQLDLHASRHLRNVESGPGSNGDKSSLLEPDAAKHGEKASTAFYPTTMPGENHSQLSPTPTGTIAAAALIYDKDEFEDVAPSVDIAGPSPFEQKPLGLASLVDSKSLQYLEAMGGTEGLLRGLGTDANLGLRSWQYTDSSQGHDLEKGEGGGTGAGVDSPRSRTTSSGGRRIHGVNQLPCQNSKSLLLWMWLTLKDKQLVFLSVAAVIELVLGLYLDFDTIPEGTLCDGGADKCVAPPVDWVEGVAIMIAVLLIVIIGSFTDWQTERQFRRLNDEDRGVKVIRDGKEQVADVKDLMVGDIVVLEPGVIVPCDGVFLRGHNVRCDESTSTGDSDVIKKVTYAACMAETRNLKPGEKSKLDCFIVSGTKVMGGVGRYIAIAVSPESFNGRIMAALSEDAQRIPLQRELKALAKLIEKLGYGASLILFTVLMIKAFIQSNANPNQTKNDKTTAVLQILISCVTLTVVVVPEGLPLAVTLVFAFVTRRMLQEGLLVRVLSSWEAMTNTSVNSGRNRKHKNDFPLDMSELNTVIPIIWGRCVHDSIRQFLQFHVSANITAVLITFISAVASDKQASFLTAVHILWINIIMGSFSALALTSDPTSPELLKRMPDRKSAPLFSVDMGKMIIGQSLYQTVVVLLLHFAGPKFWGRHTEKEDVELSTMVFNTFVFCQIFNSINCRSLTQDKNIFRGLTKNWYSIAITLIEVGVQILIVCVGGAVFQVTPMNGRDWGVSIALGFVSIPLGFLIRCIPTPPIERLLIALHIMHDPEVRSKPTEAETAKV